MLFCPAPGKQSYLHVRQTSGYLVSMGCIWKRLETELVDQQRRIFLSMIDANEGSWDGSREGFVKGFKVVFTRFL